MGHDTHFLSRLQRVEGRALDLALGLYRDTQLLHWTLKRLPLPDNEEVVALPLNNAPEPPYALVSRTGKFITCLASGMRPAEARVPWDALTAATREMEAWRALRAEGQDRTNLVMRRMRTAGPWLAREDFEDLLVISAMAPKAFLDHLLEGSHEVLEFQERYRPSLFRTLNDRSMGILSSVWKQMWATSHATLVHVESAVRLEAIRPGRSKAQTLLNRVLLQAYHNLDGMYVRAGWCIGRMGHLVKEEALTLIRDALASDRTEKGGSITSTVIMIYGLVAMTVRVPELAADILRQLEEMLPPRVLELTTRPNALVEMGDHLDSLGLEVSARETAVALGIALLREAPEFKSARNEILFVLRDFMHGPTGEGAQVGPERRRPHRAVPEVTELPPDYVLPSPDEFPEDLIYVVPFNTVGNTWVDTTLTVSRMALMPLLARREAVDQFFTRSRLADLASTFKLHAIPSFVRAHIESSQDGEEPPAPRSATPGRNEACSCGSGKKYKKCCGA